MSGRIYKIEFENVLVAAAQDLVQVKGAAGKIVEILRCWVGCVDVTVATGQMMRLRARFLPATVTDGSGGTAGTVVAEPGDAAASLTALINNTTPATTSGTAAVHYANGCHLYQGDNWRFDSPIPVGPSESFVYELLSTVSGTVHLSGGVLVRELGG